jgi:alcohol dehydrogenase (cytochrome c)/quinohemoprotein ethanol dehydrogenase
MTTAGNLVFQGTSPHNFTAFRADTGEKVWSADSGSGIAPGSVSYEIGGVQYIAVVAGGAGAGASRLLVYKLGGTVALPPPQPPSLPVLNPPAAFGTPEQLSLGREKYTQNCVVCHEGTRMTGGFPDLRYTPLLMSAEGFKAVVYDGVLTDNGMLSFKKALTPDEIEAIRAHLVSVANDLKQHPQPAFAGFGPPPGGAPAPPPQEPTVGLHQ